MKKEFYFFLCKLYKSTWVYLVVFIGLGTNSVIAQSKNITGTITDEIRTPLPGANIIEKGTPNGVISDFDGHYAISVSDGATLVISYVGFKTEEIVVGNQSVINITLEASNILDEVVVIGYGTQRKSDLTGAVSSVRAEELTKIPLTRADQLMQGKMAGVQITSTDGSPEANVKIRIRGANSINGNNDPLVVIDGFLGGSLGKLNPADIQSIEVLKDASATAVYGSRGSNGVILVTTKSGKSGKMKVEFSTFVTSNKLRKKLDLLNAEQYALTRNARAVDTGGSPEYSDSDIANFRTNGGTDWQDQIFRTGFLQNNNLAISGGSDKSTYLFSLNHVNQKGIIINSKYKRYQLRANLNSKINDKIKFGLRLYGVREESSPQPFNSGIGTPVSDSHRFPPTFQSVYDETGAFTTSSDPMEWNPVASALSYNSDRATNTFMANAFMEFSISDYLTFKVSGGTSYSQRNSYLFRSIDNRNAFANNGTANISNRESIGWINTNNLTYSKDINDSDNLTATLVYEQQKKSIRENGYNAQNFITQSLGYYGADLAETVSGQYVDALIPRVSQAVLGRVNYSLKDKYLFTVSGRYDGSSVLAEGNKWQFFPSAAFAWKMKNENFLTDIDAISDLKLRLSYGKVGSQAVAPGSSLATLIAGINYALDGASPSVGVGVGSTGNKDLGWETTSQYDIGFDASFLDRRLRLSADYYYKNTTDLLLRVSVPFSSGLPNTGNPPTILKNLGELENKGFELGIGASPVRTDNFNWDLNLSLSTNKTKVINLGEEDQILGAKVGGSSTLPAFIIEVGEPLGNIHGLEYLGVWKSNEADQAAVYGNVPGDSKYRDVTNDNNINAEDRIIIGNGTPKLNWGLSQDFSYKNFDLNIFFNGAQGHDIYNYTRATLVNSGSNGLELLNRWTPSNENTNVPAFSSSDSNRSNTSRFVENASFIRLKSLVLGYNLDSNVLDKLKLTNARIYVGAQNLWTLTDYTGYDPEVNSLSNRIDSSNKIIKSNKVISSDVNNGVDQGGYPPSKSITLGLNLTF